MAIEPIVENVTKGGILYFEMIIDKKADGLEIWFKTDPQVEAFMKSLAAGQTPKPLEAYGQTWEPAKASGPILVYRIDGVQREQYTLRHATLDSVCGSLGGGEDALVNLSFLRFVGSSAGGGIRFKISGPFSLEYSRDMATDIKMAVRDLIKEYVVPAHIELRISSKEM